jgi:hypothetical protein
MITLQAAASLSTPSIGRTNIMAARGRHIEDEQLRERGLREPTPETA